MLLSALAFAQTELPDPPIFTQGGYNIAGGVGTKKSIGDAETGGLYTLKLETFATGKTEVIETTAPADIVLVLDVSGSMNSNMAGNTQYAYYNAANRTSWTPDLLGTGSSGWNYSDGYVDYYYKHTDGQYFQVYRERNNIGSWNRPSYVYRYRVTINGSYQYLTPNGLSTSASYVADNVTVWNGLLYTRVQGRTRLHALKQAVGSFVNEVNHNALYDKDGNLRDKPVHHQISIVKFANDQYYGSESSIVEGNHFGAGFDSRDDLDADDEYNYTEVRIGFKDVSNSQNASDVVSAVNSLNYGGATAANYGMTKAKYLLDSVKDRKSTKVVVLFTDGEPGITGWNTGFANNTISVSADLKKAVAQGGYDAIVYTVGVFGNLGDNRQNVLNYMSYVSSNYPAATSMSDAGEGSDQGYFTDASSESADLTEIFTKIATDASSVVPEIEATTQVVDVVSNSFEVPSNFTADQVVVYTLDINTAGTAFDENSKHTLTKVNLTNVEGFDPTAAPPADADYMTDENKVGVYLKDGKLIILGFNYSKADSPNADGSTAHPYGNWVGFRKQNVAAGKELVVEFKIEADPAATGGDGTSTNSPESGVYVLTPDGYANVNSYAVQHTDLPINIVIQKNGLRAGESATVQIYRCHQKKVNGVVQYNERTGKPLPEIDMPNPGQDPNDLGWENFTKVILTNTMADLDPVTKTLLSLHADYVYLLVEDNWGWAYILDDAIMSTDEVEKNPFVFTNTENSEAVKHAEAAAINHFGDGYSDKDRVKTYKSSKTILNTNSGSSNSGSSDSE